jgi:2-amino-4-hydroxy-6-hydroxymethyldihydropteridine diphosphokinase
MINDLNLLINNPVPLLTDQPHDCWTEHRSAIALGSNLGDSLTILQQACASLAETEGIELISCSSWYQTQPIGPPQPDYLNGCVLVKTKLSPLDLLKCLWQIEQQFGRERKERWGARTLDLDIILYDNLIMNNPDLQIPHPRMRERAFVLIPLAEIAPNWLEPVTGEKIIDLKNKFNQEKNPTLFLT